MEITHPYPQEILLEVEEDIDGNTNTKQPQGYDWDEYDEYLKPPHDEEGGEPEA